VKILRFLFGIAIAGSFLRAQGPQPDGPLRGEIRASNVSLRDDLVVELRPTSAGSGHDLRTEVAPDGRFEIRGLEPGIYTVVVRTRSGAVLQQQTLDIAAVAQPLVIELAEPKGGRPPSGPVSVTELSHAPPKQAVKMAAHALHLSDAGQHAKAAAELEKALQVAPEFADAHNDLGVQYVALGRHEEALGQFQAAVRIAPGMARAHSNLALALWKLGRAAEAESSVRRAVALDPASAKAHLILGTLLAGQAQHREEAVRELRRAAPEASSALLMLARLYARAGESGKAQDALQEYRRREGQPALPEESSRRSASGLQPR
jgi:tetratricopeptide (TPR) repeat protein